MLQVTVLIFSYTCKQRIYQYFHRKRASSAVFFPLWMPSFCFLWIFHSKANAVQPRLNRLYLRRNALWEIDDSYDGFKWVDCKSDNQCVFAYTRTGRERTLLTVLNFSDREANIAPALAGQVSMLLRTDWEPFGGTEKPSAIRHVPCRIPPYCGMLFSLAPRK